MTSSAEDKWDWQPSPIGITPLSIRPRAGKRRVQKFDVNGGAASPAVGAAPGLQGNPADGGDGAGGNNPYRIVVPARPGGGEGRGEGLAPSFSTSSSARPAARRVCSVCVRASADYSCPRCLIGYCSSKCYKVGAGLPYHSRRRASFRSPVQGFGVAGGPNKIWFAAVLPLSRPWSANTKRKRRQTNKTDARFFEFLVLPPGHLPLVGSMLPERPV